MPDVRTPTGEPPRLRPALLSLESLISVLVVVCALIGASAAPTVAATNSAPVTRPVVVIYGDSIVHAAAPFVEVALARYGVTLIDASVGATAPCDALQFVNSDMTRYDPELVVIGLRRQFVLALYQRHSGSEHLQSSLPRHAAPHHCDR